MANHSFNDAGPIEIPAEFSGRQKEVSRIFECLSRRKCVSIVGERKFGKTSLLKYILGVDAAGRFAVKPITHLFVFLDVQGYSKPDTPLKFWHDILDKISETVADSSIQTAIAEAKSGDILNTTRVGRLLGILRGQQQSPVLLLDEFEKITGNPNFGEDFLDQLRYLASNDGLVLITSTQQKLGDLCYSKQLASSPFFNIFEPIELGLFSSTEADELIDKGLRNTSVIFEQTDREYLKQITGCHPFLLQTAGVCLFRAYGMSLSSPERLDYVREQLTDQMEGHFGLYWSHATSDEKLVLRDLARTTSSIANQREADKPQARNSQFSYTESRSRLLKRGLLVKNGGEYAVFSPLFAEWIAMRSFAAANIGDAPSTPQEKSQVRILHLSDIHLGTQDQAAMYRTRLETDLLQEQQVKNVEYLIISGDLADRSTPGDYAAAHSLINGIMLRFRIAPDRVIVVPGNHDVNWDLSKRAFSRIPFLTRVLSPNEERYRKRFANFSAHFYEKVYDRPYPADYADQGILFSSPNDHILFLGLNSSWQVDHWNRKRTGIHQRALSGAIDQLQTGEYDDWLKIAVCHHPIAGLDMMNDDFVELLAVHGFQVYIHGHVHRASEGFYRYDAKRGLHIVAAGTFGAPARDQVPGIPLQYNLLFYAAAKREITVELRSKDRPEGAWHAGAVDWIDKRDPKPRYTIKLR